MASVEQITRRISVSKSRKGTNSAQASSRNFTIGGGLGRGDVARLERHVDGTVGDLTVAQLGSVADCVILGSSISLRVPRRNNDLRVLRSG
ncbi:hypothetical protein, partial [Nonomuraea sp. NPDC049758]|uniref:hypothetical protein n=1 Tax=Nonomuraea sp. NPDC049758 TaxID=3154360 RepID=UPI003413E4D2